MPKIRCMFCYKEKESSIEHIIPKSLGNNTLTTNFVCKDCNSKLGDKIDAPFVNNPIFQIKRQQLGLKGYTGKLPNLLSRGKDSDGNTVLYNEKSGFYFESKIQKISKDEYSLIANSKKEANNMLEKKKKRGKTDPRILDSLFTGVKETKVQKVHPSVTYKYSAKLSSLDLGLLKIAYECMYQEFGEKFGSDKQAKKIRDILLRSVMEKSVSFNECHQMIVPIQTKKLAKGKNNQPYHIIWSVKNKYNQLILVVQLFNESFIFGVLVSNDASAYDGICQKRIAIN